MQSQQMLAKYAWLTPRLVAATAKSTMSTSLISLTVSLTNTPPHTHTQTHKRTLSAAAADIRRYNTKRAENNLIKTDFNMFSLCLCGLPASAPASFHSPKTRGLIGDSKLLVGVNVRVMVVCTSALRWTGDLCKADPASRWMSAGIGSSPPPPEHEGKINYRKQTRTN